MIVPRSKSRKWKDSDLLLHVKGSKSISQVIIKLGLIPAGGNYNSVKTRIQELQINTSHFTGKGWRKGTCIPVTPSIKIEDILNNISKYQSHKLKNRLFSSGLKKRECEMCGWAKESVDGRIPLELDHVNGNHGDNSLSNLRILCPNCHSLQPTHRGRNKSRK